MKYADTRPYAFAVCGLAGLALSVSIAAAAEIKSYNLKDDTRRNFHLRRYCAGRR